MVSRRPLVALLVVLPLLAGVVPASPQPSPVCAACGAQFEAAAESTHPVNVTTSTLDVHLRADGSERRVVRNRVNASAADYYRDHPDELDAIARASYTDSWTLRNGIARNVTARLDGRTVVVTGDAADASHRSLGVLLYDRYLTDHMARWAVNAERFTVHAPAAFHLAHADGAARTNETAATWTGRTTDRRYGYQDIDDAFTHRTIVAFAPDDGVGTALTSWVAVRLPGALVSFEQFLGIMAPVAIVLSVAVGLAVGLGRAARSWDVRWLGGGLAVVGGAGVAWGLSALGRTGTVHEVAVAAGAGTVALAALGHPRLRPTSLARAAAAAFGLAVAVGLAVLAVGWADWGVTGVFDAGLGLLPALLALFVVAGYAGVRGHRSHWPLLAAVYVPFVAVVAGAVPVYGGFGPAFIMLVLAGTALAVGVAAIPLYALGAALAGQPAASRSE